MEIDDVFRLRREVRPTHTGGARFSAYRCKRGHAEYIAASPQELPARLIPHPVLDQRMLLVDGYGRRSLRCKLLCLALFKVDHDFGSSVGSSSCTSANSCWYLLCASSSASGPIAL